MLVFCDSFDHYATANLLAKYSTISQSPTIGGGGRFGNRLNCSSSNNSAFAVKNLGANYGTLISGVAWLLGSGGSAHGAIEMAGFRDSGTTQIGWGVNPTGTISIYKGTGVIATSTDVLPTLAGVWYYIELKVVFAASGSVELRVNGVTWLSFSADTTQTANNFANQFWMRGVSSQQGGCFFDDLYVLNDTDSGVTGAPNNDFLGDCRVQAIFPNGNGNSSQLVGSDADSTDNYLLVDETAPDGDTTYVQSNVVGEKDTYTYDNLTPTTGVVFGVQAIPWALKTDAGSRSLASVARLGTTEEDSAAKLLSTSYQYLPDIREADPDGNQWTIANVNAAEFGVKVAA